MSGAEEWLNLPRKRETRIVRGGEVWRRGRLVKLFRVRDELTERILFEGEWREVVTWRKENLR